jgi:hypothetical protein
MKAFLTLSISFLLLIALVAACADLSNIQKALPDSVQTVFVQPVEDKSNQPAMAQILNEQIPQAFVANGRLQVVSSTANADVILTETLQRYDLIVTLRDSFQAAVRYRMQIMMDADLTDAKTGKVLITTRRTVQLTPTPVGGSSVNVDQFDSTEVRTLLEFTNYYTVNSLGRPPEDLTSAQQRLAGQMVQRIITLVVDDSGNPVVAPTPTPPAGHDPFYVPAR